jgi:hypothetical protein
MKWIRKKEWLYRAIRTFIQAALGYAAANIALIELTDSAAVKTLLASAISAGLAAIMNADIFLPYKDDTDTDNEDKEE